MRAQVVLDDGKLVPAELVEARTEKSMNCTTLRVALRQAQGERNTFQTIRKRLPVNPAKQCRDTATAVSCVALYTFKYPRLRQATLCKRLSDCISVIGLVGPVQLARTAV